MSLTHEQIDAIEALRELDGEIAVHVFGWTKKRTDYPCPLPHGSFEIEYIAPGAKDGYAICYDHEGKLIGDSWRQGQKILPNYSTDFNQSILVIRELARRIEPYRAGGYREWDRFCTILTNQFGDEEPFCGLLTSSVSPAADTCRAALKAVLP